MKIKLFLFTLASLFLVYCAKDRSYVPAEGETEIEMTLLSVSSPASRAAVAAEDVIKTVDLLVFDASAAGGNEDQATFLYARYAWKKTNATYRATLKTGTNLNIYCAVNARSLIQSAGLTEGMTHAQVKELLMLSDPSQVGLTNGLPMWGHAPLPSSITESASVSLGTIRLLRSVASVDVSVADTDFSMSKGHIVFAADKGYLPYTSSNVYASDDRKGQIMTPEVPASMTTTKEWSYTMPTGEGINNVFYLFENDADGTSSSKRYTKVILEGVWNGSGKTTYYPLALRDADSNNKLKVLRNTKFIIIVTKVNGDGYDTLNDAKDGEDVNMDYSVIEWNQHEDGDIQIDGSKYFSIGSKKAVLASQQGATVELKFQTNYALGDIRMKYDEGDTGATGSIDTHDRFKVEVLTNTTGDPIGFKITAKQAYADTDNPATLIVTAGRIKYIIEMEQMDDVWNLGDEQDDELTFP